MSARVSPPTVRFGAMWLIALLFLCASLACAWTATGRVDAAPAQRAGALLVRGPPSLARGVSTTFTLQASVWSPTWLSIDVTATVDPIGAAALGTIGAIHSTVARTFSVTSQRSDHINITIRFQLSASGYLLPPENLVLTTAGAAIWTLVGMAKCRAAGTLDGGVTRDHPMGNSNPVFTSPHSFIYSKQANKFFPFSATTRNIRTFDPVAQSTSVAAGTPGSGTSAAAYASADGTGTLTQFRSMSAATVDRAGAFIYFADETTLRRMEVATSTVTTLVGTFDTTAALYTARLTEINARLPFWPTELMMDGVGSGKAGPYAAGDAIIRTGCIGMALDELHQRLYFTDSTWHLLRFVQLDAADLAVRTVHGTPGMWGHRDSTGVALSGLLNRPAGLAVVNTAQGSEAVQSGSSTAFDFSSRLFIADEMNHAIRVMDLRTLALSTFVGSPGLAADVDGVGTAAGVYRPIGVIIDSSNSYLFISSRSSSSVRRVSLHSGVVETLPMRGFAPLSVTSVSPHPHWSHLAYLVDSGAHQVWQLDFLRDNEVTPFLGGRDGCDYRTSVPGLIDGVGMRADSVAPSSIQLNPFMADQLLVTDRDAPAVRTVDLRDNAIRTVVRFPATLMAPTFLASQDGLVFVASTTAVIWANLHTGAYGALAGVHGSTGSADSPSALFTSIGGMAISAASTGSGLLYIGDQCRLRTIDISGALAVDSTVVSSLSGEFDECRSVEGGPGMARFSEIRSVMVVSASVLYVAESTTTGANIFCGLSHFDLQTLERTVVAGGNICAEEFDDFGLAARFVQIRAMAYSGDTNYIYVVSGATSGTGLRFLDSSTRRVGTVLASTTSFTMDGASSVGIIGVNGVAAAPTGHQLYVVESHTNSHRIRAVALFAKPVVSDISPSIGPANKPAVVTLNGFNFGASAFELVAITARSSDSASGVSREFRCALVQWLSASQVMCRLASNVPVDTELRFCVNVRGVWGEVSSRVFRTVSPPSIASVSPSVSSTMPARFHLFGSFGASIPTDLIGVTYGATGVEFGCHSLQLQNSSYVTCVPASNIVIGARVVFMVNVGNQYSAASSSSYTHLSVAPYALTSVCPSSVPSIYSSSVLLVGDFSALNPNDAFILPVVLVVQFRRSDNAAVTESGINARVLSTTQLSVETPLDLPAGSSWDVRVNMADLLGSWLPAALTVVTASSPILSVTQRIVEPMQPAALTLTYDPAFFCATLLPRTDISGVWWGGNGADRSAPTFTLDEEARIIRVTLPAQDLAVAGAMHAFALQVRGVRSPPSLRDYRQTNPTETDELFKRFAFGPAAIFVQSRLDVQAPSKLSGAVPLTIAPVSAPMFGPLVLKVDVYAKPSLPIGATESLQSTIDVTWTGADWKAREVPITLLSVAATFRIEMTLDAASPSAPYFLAPAASISLSSIAAVPTRTVFGPGPQCSASGNDSSMLADPLGARGLLQNPADALFDPSTGSYLILDQDGAVLRRWFPATGTWQLVFGVEQAPEGLPTDPRDGPLSQALFGRSNYSRSVMTLTADGSCLYLYDAAHWQIRVVDFASATSSLISGVNAGPLVRDPATGIAWNNNWMIGGSNAAGQRWLDVKALAVDRDELYLYVLEMQFIRRINLVTGGMQLLSGRDSYWPTSNDYSDGVGPVCMWGASNRGSTARSSIYGISAMLLSKDGSTLYAADRFYIKSINTVTAQCRTIAGSTSRSSYDGNPGTNARMQAIMGMTFDAAQSALLVFEASEYSRAPAIRRVDLTNPNFPVSTPLRLEVAWGTRDGPLGGVEAERQGAMALATSWRMHPSDDFFYFADNAAHRIRTLDLAKQQIGTLVGGGAARRADDDASDPNGSVCPGEGTIPGVTDATGLDAQFNILIGMFVSPPVTGHTRVMWVCDWQNASMSTVRRVDLDSDAVTTPFTLPGHVVDFQNSATQANIAFMALHNAAGSIFRLNLDTSSYDQIGVVNMGPLGILGRVRSITTLDDSEIWVAIEGRPALFSLSTGLHPDLMLRAGAVAATASGDIDAKGVAARFGMVKHLCPSPDGVFIYFSTWAPFKVLRFHSLSSEVRTIAGLSLARTPAVPVPRDGFPPNAALAYPTTMAVSPDGKSLFVLEYLAVDSAARYDRSFETETYQTHFHLRQISLATGEVTTLGSVNDGGAPLSVSQILTYTGVATTNVFEPPHPLAFSRSASPTDDGVDGVQLYVGRETRVRVLAVLGSPNVVDVRPRVWQASASVTITLTGTGFGNAAADLLAVEYRDQTAFPSSDTGVAGSLMPSVSTCVHTWQSSTRITCTLTTGSAVGARLAFRVRVAASDGRRLVSRHSSVQLLVIPTPLVAAVQSNTGHAGSAQRVTLRTATRLGFGSSVEARTVRYGVVGSTSSVACTDVQHIDEFSLSCMVGADTAATTSYWFAVTVGEFAGVLNSAVTAVNSFTTVPDPMLALSGVCPTSSRLVGQAQMVTLLGNYFGSDARDISVTLGATGFGFQCSDVRLVSTNTLSCIIPEHLPLDYGHIRFRVSVRGRSSAVSASTFYLHSLAVVPNGAVDALVSSMMTARITPNVAGQVISLYSATGGFGTCAAMLTGVFYTTSATLATSATFPTACTSYEWLSSSEVRCTLPAMGVNNIIRGQVELLGVRGPGSVNSMYSEVKRSSQISNIPPSMIVDSQTIPRPVFATSVNSNPWTLRITATQEFIYSTGSSQQWPSVLSNPPVPTTFIMTVNLDCNPAMAVDALAACDVWLRDTFVLTPIVISWVYDRAPLITTAAGPGGCRNSGNRDGVQDTADFPLLWNAQGGVVTDDFVYVQEFEYGGIRQFDRRTRNISSLSGHPTNNPGLIADGTGASASWSWRSVVTPMAMAYDGRDFIYAMDYYDSILRSVHMRTGQTITVYGTQKTRCSTCSWNNCPASCYSASDSVCGTSAVVGYTSGLAADPQGRYVYIADRSVNSLRRIDTTTWCPKTLVAPSPSFVTTPMTHRNGLHLYARIGSAWFRIDVQTGAAVPMGGIHPPRAPSVTIGPSELEWYDMVQNNDQWTLRRWPIRADGLTFLPVETVMQVSSIFWRDGHASIAGIYSDIKWAKFSPSGHLIIQDDSQRLRQIDIVAQTIVSLVGGGEQEQCVGTSQPNGPSGTRGSNHGHAIGPIDGGKNDVGFAAPSCMAFGPLAPTQLPFEFPYAYFVDSLKLVRRYEVATGEVRTLRITAADPAWPVPSTFYALGVSPVWSQKLMVIAAQGYLMRVDLDTRVATWLCGQLSLLGGTDGTKIH